MAIILNDNIKINAGKPSESKYLNTGNTAYLSESAVCAQIPISERYVGLTVLVDTGATNVEYWFRENVSTLVQKKFASTIPEGDFVTGATNLGYFSGTSNIQTLNINANLSANDGNYLSLYNYYYINDSGIISIGNPSGSTFRRGYVRDTLPLKSWIYSYYNGGSYQTGWQLIDTDISENIGVSVDSTVVNVYSGTQYTETEWWYTGGTGGGFYNNSGNLTLQVYGDLYSGSSVLTIGARPYAFFDHNNLHFRTIISDTPNLIAVRDDNTFIHISGQTSILSGQNLGTGKAIFAGQTGTTLGFRTLTQSGDTTITQRADGGLTIYSSSNGSANAITGATNYGSGTTVYSGTTARNLHFNTLVGSGNTSVSKVGNDVIIYSQGGGTYDLATPATVTVGGITPGFELTGCTAFELFQKMLIVYQTPTFSSFSNTIPTTVEVGCSISGSQSFTWAFTNASNVSGNSMCIRDITSGVTLATNISTFSPQAATITTKTFTSCGDTQVWCGSAKNTCGAQFNSSLRTITAYLPYYWGTCTCPGPAGANRPIPTSNMVTGGTKILAPATGTLSISFNSGADDYLWFAIPSSVTDKTAWCIPTLSVGGTIGGGIGVGCNLFPSVIIDNACEIPVTTLCWSSCCYDVYISNKQSQVACPMTLG